MFILCLLKVVLKVLTIIFVVVCDDVHVKVDGDVVHDCNMYNDIANADDDYVDNDGDDG